MEHACASDGKVEAVVGTIVWVRRRNGSWWPGRIISEEELLTANLLSPRSGTPVKLLGREDGSVDWYNIEKSKRVKAFRCGDFEDCIERAKALAEHSGKRREKYARREDAILDALELEKQQHNSGFSEPSKTKESGEASVVASRASNLEPFSGVRSAAYIRSGHCKRQSLQHVQGIAQSYRLAAQANSRPDFRSNEHRLEMEADCQNGDSVPRMRGLQDLGMKSTDVHGNSQLTMLENTSGDRWREASAVTRDFMSCGLEYNGIAAHWKKKRSLGDVSLKRRDRKRPLMQVLEKSVKLCTSPESLSSLKDPSIEIRPYVHGNGLFHVSPQSNISQGPKSCLLQCSDAVSSGLNLSGCGTWHAQSTTLGCLDQKGLISTAQLLSCPSIPGSYSNMSCTYHGISSSLSLCSIDKHSSNAEPQNNKIKHEEAIAQMEVKNQMGSVGHQSPYPKGMKSSRSQKVVLVPLQPSETSSVNHMTTDKAAIVYEAECFGFNSKIRSKRHRKVKSQAFSEDIVETFQSKKGVMTSNGREFMNLEFKSDRGDFDFPFSYHANSSDHRHQMLHKVPAKRSIEAECSLYASNLARKSSPKIQQPANHFISRNLNHPHAWQTGSQSSKGNRDIRRNSSVTNFRYPVGMWCDIHVDSQETSQKESVPMVLMASKLNRKPIIGHPVVVEVVELNNFCTFFQGQGAVNDERLDEVQHFLRRGKRTSRQRGRRLSFAVAYEVQRDSCNSNLSQHVDHRPSLVVDNDDATNCMDGHSRMSLLISKNVDTFSKQTMVSRKRRESLYKVRLSKKVLRRVCLASKKTRTRTLSSIADEQRNGTHEYINEYEKENPLASLAEAPARINSYQETEGVSSGGFKQPNLKIPGPDMLLTKCLLSQHQGLELPAVAPSNPPVSACIPVRVAFERLKAAVYEDHKLFLN